MYDISFNYLKTKLFFIYLHILFDQRFGNSKVEFRTFFGKKVEMPRIFVLWNSPFFRIFQTLTFIATRKMTILFLAPDDLFHLTWLSACCWFGFVPDVYSACFELDQYCSTLGVFGLPIFRFHCGFHSNDWRRMEVAGFPSVWWQTIAELKLQTAKRFGIFLRFLSNCIWQHLEYCLEKFESNLGKIPNLSEVCHFNLRIVLTCFPTEFFHISYKYTRYNTFHVVQQE